MFAIVGAAGTVGLATARALREAGMPVRAILRDAGKAARLEAIGCEIRLADLQDGGALSRAIEGAGAVQIVAPLRPQAGNPAEDLRRSIDGLMETLARASPERVLAISDYGAHVTHDIGMPSLFRDFEARLRRIGGRVTILRSAEHMHNWARGIPAAIASGTLPSLQDPVGRAHPTISAGDLGTMSADLLMRPVAADGVTLVHAEGPHRYSADDVAEALSRISGQAVQARAVPRAEWGALLAPLPAALADLLAKANDAKNQGGLVDVGPDGEVRRGTTALIDALRPLVPPR